jgi:hypothetical protein
MDDFPSRFAESLLEDLAGPEERQLSADEQEAVLELARIVAHGTERKNAPLASYVTGLFVGAHGLSPGARAHALDRAVKKARELLM